MKKRTYNFYSGFAYYSFIESFKGVGWYRPISKFMLFYSILFSYFQRVFDLLGEELED